MSQQQRERRKILERVRIYGRYLHRVSDHYKSEREIVLTAILRDGVAIKYASETLKKDREIVMTAVQGKGESLKFVSPNFRNDKEVVIQAIRNDPSSLQFASERLRGDFNVVMEAIQRNVSAARHACLRCFNEAQLIHILTLFQSSREGEDFFLVMDSHFQSGFSDSINLITKAIKMDWRCLKFANTRLRNNRELVNLALKGSVRAFEFVGDRLKDTRELVINVLGQDGRMFRFASERLKQDKNVCFKAFSALRRDALDWSRIEDMKTRKEFVLVVVKSNGCSLKDASENMKNDKEIVMEAVKSDGYALKYASEDLKNDKEVVVEAVKSDGSSLEFASEDVKNYKKVVLEAVKSTGVTLKPALKYASEDLKNDKEVVVEAVKSNGYALKYASEELRSDPCFLKLFSKRSTCEHIGSALRNSSPLAERMWKYKGDVERALEEFESEDMEGGKIEDQNPKLNKVDRSVFEFCCDIMKIGGEGIEYMLANETRKLISEIEKHKMEVTELMRALTDRNDPLFLGRARSLGLLRRIEEWEKDFKKLDIGGVSFRCFRRSDVIRKEELRVGKEIIGEFSFQDLRFFRILGKGVFGRTYLCRVRGRAGLFVVKLHQQLSRGVKKNQLKRDCLLLNEGHENVTPILYHTDTENIDLSKLPDYDEHWKGIIGSHSTVQTGGMLIMKFHQTSLQKCIDSRYVKLNLRFIQQRPKDFDPVFYLYEVIVIMKGVVSGAHYLKKNWIVHRDLHPGNIFCHPPTGQVWIGDFGCSLDLRSQKSFKVGKESEILLGTAGYAKRTGGCREFSAPEIRNFDEAMEVLDYSKSDLYSCGKLGKLLLDNTLRKPGGLWGFDFVGVPNRNYQQNLDLFSELVELMVKDFDARIGFEKAIEVLEKIEDSLGEVRF